MKTVITDWTFPDLAIEEGILKPLGTEVVARPCRSEPDLLAATGDADVVITQFARLTPAVIQGMRRAKAIIRYGIGVDNVDLAAASACGIPVCNVPDYCIDEVADHTLALLLSLTRQIPAHHAHVQAGHWGLATPLEGFRSLAGQQVTLVGFGRIGRQVLARLLPFRVRVRVFDPMLSPEAISQAGATPVATLEEALPLTDILSLHCPSTSRTRQLIGEKGFALLKPGALLLNVARGDLVDTAALIQALDAGRLAGAGLDVCDPEPIPAGHPLLGRPNVILAPHVASCSVPAVTRLRKSVATLAATALRGELPPNVVNGVTTLPHHGSTLS